jgi:phage repressor protein C with HTH and peptisase S24 domain
MEDWKNRLKQARENKGLNKTEFAKLVKVSNPTVTDWEKSFADGGIKEISGTKLTRVCDILGIEAEWLLTGKGKRERSPAQLIKQELAVYEVPPSKFRQIPVIGKGVGGLPDERIWTDGDFPVGSSDEYAEVATSDPNAFISRVEEASMAPRYNPGEYFLVEPNTIPEIGDDVFVKFKNDGTSLKRLLSRRDGFIALGSYNTTTTITVKENEIAWIYYVAHPVPVRKIKQRV